MWSPIVISFGLSAVVMSNLDPRCQGGPKGNSSDCPYGGNLSSNECEYYACCYDNSTSPKCYKKAPDCQKLACEDNATTTIECPEHNMIDIVRVKNIAKDKCNSTTDICESHIRYPNITKNQCNNQTRCVLPNMTPEDGQGEQCTTFDEHGNKVNYTTTSQEVCYRCYPIPTTTTTSTTTTALPTSSSANITVVVGANSGVNIQVLLYIVVPAVVVVIVALVLLGLWYRYRYRTSEYNSCETDDYGPKPEGPPSKEELELNQRPDLVAEQYEDVIVMNKGNDGRQMFVKLENDENAEKQRMLDKEQEVEALYAKPEKLPPPVPKKNFKLNTLNSHTPPTRGPDPLYSLEKKVDKANKASASPYTTVLTSTDMQDMPPEEARKGYPKPSKGTGEYDTLNLGTLNYHESRNKNRYNKVKDTAM